MVKNTLSNCIFMYTCMPLSLHIVAPSSVPFGCHFIACRTIRSTSIRWMVSWNFPNRLFLDRQSLNHQNLAVYHFLLGPSVPGPSLPWSSLPGPSVLPVLDALCHFQWSRNWQSRICRSRKCSDDEHAPAILTYVASECCSFICLDVLTVFLFLRGLSKYLTGPGNTSPD